MSLQTGLCRESGGYTDEQLGDGEATLNEKDKIEPPT